MAVLIGFIEAVAVHASEAAADDVAAHDHAADILSGVAPNGGHRSNAGASFVGATHQLPDETSSFADAAQHPSDSASSFADAAHQPSDNASSFADAAHLLSDNASSFDDATHQLSSGGSSSEDSPFGHADDAALSASASSTGSNDDHDAGPALANSDSFWFNADGPVHISLDADHGVHAATDSFAAVFDVFAENSAANAEVTFTSAASSSFQYSGPSILDTAPGGASAHWTDAIDAPTSTIPLANFTTDAAEPSELHQANSIVNNIVIGGGSSKPEAANASVASAGSAQVLEAWNGDLGSGYMSTAAAGTAASSGSVPGVTSADNGQGLVINVVYDSSVASAPAGFTQTIADVVNFYESQFSTPVTITIDVGYGEIDGQAVQAGALGENQANMTSVSYSQLEAALANNANAIGDTAAAASLSATSPVNGQYWIPTAEAQALGLASGGGVDGYAGFTSVPYLDYNVGNNSGTVPGSQYDFFGVVAHEFSEIMGRQMFDGADFAGAAGYTALDLFHYSSPGVRDFSGTTAGYFSPDGGSPGFRAG
ncbi:MAG: NF038122 family metalloprotease [Xanthobacteraceae bacterium]